MMRKAAWAIPCWILALALAQAGEPVVLPAALAPGDAAPGLRGTRVSDGQLIVIRWSDARLNVVNFWATWCTYCKDQMPVLQQMWAGKQDQGLRVIGVNEENDLTLDEIKRYYEPLNVQYLIVQAVQETNFIWGGIQAMPTSFLIDSHGTVLRRYVGATPEQTRGLVADVEAVLQGKPMGNLVIPVEPAVSDAPLTVEEAEKKKQEARDYEP